MAEVKRMRYTAPGSPPMRAPETTTDSFDISFETNRILRQYSKDDNTALAITRDSARRSVRNERRTRDDINLFGNEQNEYRRYGETITRETRVPGDIVIDFHHGPNPFSPTNRATRSQVSRSDSIEQSAPLNSSIVATPRSTFAGRISGVPATPVGTRRGRRRPRTPSSDCPYPSIPMPDDLRPIIIDGMNVGVEAAKRHGYHFTNRPPVCFRGILNCYRWFESRGHAIITVVLPTIEYLRSRRYRLYNLGALDDLVNRQPYAVTYPTGSEIGPNGNPIDSHDDYVIFDLIKNVTLFRGAVVVSRDQFRDHYEMACDERDRITMETIESRILPFNFAYGQFVPPQDPLGGLHYNPYRGRRAYLRRNGRRGRVANRTRSQTRRPQRLRRSWLAEFLRF